jgi:phosphohistidine phosphatase
MAEHRLLLLRHAQAVDVVPGLPDHERPLTDYGIEQATAVGAALRAHGTKIDNVLCSSATRTRQTLAALGLDTHVDDTDELYNASSQAILALIRLLEDEVSTAMVIGHAPGLPSLAVQLAGQGSDTRALEVINNRYPTATITEYEMDAPWAEAEVGRLLWLRVGS